jgi:hypothetical protein
VNPLARKPGNNAITAEGAENGDWERRKECGGTRFLQKAGFPRTPSGKNSHLAGGKDDATVEAGLVPARFLGAHGGRP